MRRFCHNGPACHKDKGHGFFRICPSYSLTKTQVKVEQMEDEIASIFAVIGASLAGGKAMTGGQRAPTTKKEIPTLTTPAGNPEQPINIQALIRAHNCFYARTTTFHVKQLKKSILSALQHKGFSFVEAKSQCITNYGRRIGFKNSYEMLIHFRDTYKTVDEVEILGEEEIGIVP